MLRLKEYDNKTQKLENALKLKKAIEDLKIHIDALKFIEVGLDVPGALYAGAPWTDLTKTGDSYFTNEGIDRLLITYAGFLEGAAYLYAGDHDLKDPRISPIYGDFHGFPPTFLVTGTRDLFLSNTARTHTKIRAAGVAADPLVHEGVSHGDYASEPASPESLQTYA